MEVYLVRHGETEGNLEKRYMGWTETPLSKRGIRQAEEAGFFLAGQNICGLHCSDLQRAVVTARIIGTGCGLEPVVTPLLREINFGRWEGLTYNQIEASHGDAIRLWHDDPLRKSAPGGETLTAVYERMRRFLDRLANEAGDGKRIAAVSHGGAIRALLYKVLNIGKSNLWEIKIDNASVSLFRREGDRYKVVYYNRTDFLEPGKSSEVPADDY